MKRLSAKKWLILAALVGGLVLAYTIVGFMGVPRLVRSQLSSFVAEKYHRQARIGEIRFNPYTFVLEAREVSFPDADGRPLLGFSRLLLNLEIATVWRRALSFSAIEIERPIVHARLRDDGALNLADLAKPFQSPQRPAPAEKSEPMRLFIERLSVTGGQVGFEDQSRSTPFREQLRPIAFELRDFSTTENTANAYSLRGASAAGERFAWDGSVELAPFASRGRFEVTKLQARTVSAYLRDSLPAELSKGVIELTGEYEFAMGKQADLKLTVRRAEVSDLSVKPKGREADYVQLQSVQVNNARLDLARQRVDLGAIRIAGGTVKGWRDPDGRINLLELMPARASTDGAAATPTGAHSSPGSSSVPVMASNAGPPRSGAPASLSRAVQPQPSAPNAPSAAARSQPTDSRSLRGEPAHTSAHDRRGGWVLSAPIVSIDGMALQFEDRFVKPAAAFTLAPIDLKIAGFSTEPGVELQIDGNVSVNKTARLAARGKVMPDSGRVSAHVDVDGFDLTALQPYLNTYTQMTVLNGSVKAGLDVERSEKGTLVVKGDTDINKLHTIDTPQRQDFVKWERLRVSGIDYTSEPARLRIATLTARAPYVRLIIHPDQSLNITHVLQPTPGSTPAAVQTVRTDSGKHTPGANPGAMRIRVDKVQVVNGSANFADFWIQPNYAVSLQDLSGSIDHLSSDPKSRAKLRLAGTVDRYAPAQIGGEINLLSGALYTDVKVSFKGVEMASVTPYSGRFAGYKIEKGKLSIDVEYQVTNRQLKANQHFVIDQLQLGERVESPDAVKLPLRLAVALLKDRNGVINLDLPVSGSLDDPQFRLAPLIWKACVNVLAKAATAPFALLGRMFGGGEQMNEIDFPAGQATLDPAAQERLSAVAKALKERPQLQLDVPASYSPEVDAPALAERKLGEHARPPADPARKFDFLLARYRRDFGARAQLPTVVEAVAARKKKDASSLDAANAELERALSEKLPIDPSALEQLAQARARAIQELLLRSGEVDASRIFMLGVNQTQPTQDKVRLALSLK